MGFKTHTVGGSWTGGGTQVADCNTTEQAAITTALEFMHNNANGGQNCVTNLGGLSSLATCLAGRTVASVEWDCRGSSCDGVFGTTDHVGGSSINLCDPALPPTGLQQDTDVTVFHEDVHSCGGLELDAWSLENHCYSGHGTFDPSNAVVQGFLGETSDVGGGLRAATFVVWERATGKVFVKVSTGGSWDSSPTISRGARLNVNAAAYTI